MRCYLIIKELGRQRVEKKRCTEKELKEKSSRKRDVMRAKRKMEEQGESCPLLLLFSFRYVNGAFSSISKTRKILVQFGQKQTETTSQTMYIRPQIKFQPQNSGFRHANRASLWEACHMNLLILIWIQCSSTVISNLGYELEFEKALLKLEGNVRHER